MIGGSILASVFGQTTFLTDIVARPVTSILILGKYVREFFIWIGSLIGLNFASLGTLFLVIVEIIIFCFAVKLFVMLVKAIKSLINLFRKDR